MEEIYICESPNNVFNSNINFKHKLSENYSVNELNNIRETIENMNKFNQIEILRILNNHKSVMLNENKYGVHINLTELQTEVLDELKTYINYVNTQELTLNNVEQQKETFKNIYFTNSNKDNLHL